MASADPQVVVPEITIPEITIPEITIPEITLPEITEKLKECLNTVSGVNIAQVFNDDPLGMAKWHEALKDGVYLCGVAKKLADNNEINKICQVMKGVEDLAKKMPTDWQAKSK